MVQIHTHTYILGKATASGCQNRQRDWGWRTIYMWGVLKMTVQTIKTWYGRKWAILDENRNVVPRGQGVAVFEYSKNGLEQARQALKEMK